MTVAERRELTDLTSAVTRLCVLIEGNGGQGVLQRLTVMERWKRNFWARTATVAVGTATVLGVSFKGFELLGKAKGWW